jgi:hypothetical protein
MLRFFRQIRQRLLTDNKFSKYLLYAVGEILLVVIGILIALQVDNWKEDIKQNKRELILLSELKSNLKTNVRNLENDISVQTKSIRSFEYILNLPNKKLPFNDSISRYLYDIDYCTDVVLITSAFQTMKSSGLEIIRSDSLRMAIVNLYEVGYPELMQETKRLEDQLWPAVVMPLFQKHFRMSNNNYIPNDYDNWLKDTEFFNMVSIRLALRNTSTTYKKKTVQQTNAVIQLIDKEFESRKTSMQGL